MPCLHVNVTFKSWLIRAKRFPFAAAHCWLSTYCLTSISARTYLFHSTVSDWWKLWTITVNSLYASNCVLGSIKFARSPLHIWKVLAVFVYSVYSDKISALRSWQHGTPSSSSVPPTETSKNPNINIMHARTGSSSCMHAQEVIRLVVCCSFLGKRSNLNAIKSLSLISSKWRTPTGSRPRTSYEKTSVSCGSHICFVRPWVGSLFRDRSFIQRS